MLSPMLSILIEIFAEAMDFYINFMDDELIVDKIKVSTKGSKVIVFVFGYYCISS